MTKEERLLWAIFGPVETDEQKSEYDAFWEAEERAGE